MQLWPSLSLPARVSEDDVHFSMSMGTQRKSPGLAAKRRKKYCPRYSAPSTPTPRVLVIRLSCNWGWQAGSVNHSPHCPFLFLSPLASLPPLNRLAHSPSALWRYFFVVANICRASPRLKVSWRLRPAWRPRLLKRRFCSNQSPPVEFVLSGARAQASLAAKGGGEIGKGAFSSALHPPLSALLFPQGSAQAPIASHGNSEARIDGLPPPLISKWKPRYLRGAGLSLGL